MGWLQKNSRKHRVHNSFNQSTYFLSSNEQNTEISVELAINEKMLRETFQECSDVVFRPISVDPKILLIYIDGLSDTKTLDKVLLEQILSDGTPSELNNVPKLRQIIQQQLVAFGEFARGMVKDPCQ